MRYGWLLVGVIAALTIGGCSSNSPNGSGSREVVVSTLAKDLGVGSSVTRVVLSVTASDMETITREADLADGEAQILLDIPIGEDRTFDMTAYNANNVVLYHGARTADVLGGQTTEVIIDLEPQVPMVKVTPIYRYINTVENAFVQIRVYNVDSLFGVSLRLEFDSTLVRVESAVAGDIFAGRDPIFFSQTRADYIAVGLTLKNNNQPQGVSATGSVISVSLQPLAAGRAGLTISRETLQLVNWRGEPLPLDGGLYIEDGEVEIGAP